MHIDAPESVEDFVDGGRGPNQQIHREKQPLGLELFAVNSVSSTVMIPRSSHAFLCDPFHENYRQKLSL